jgi:Domain of unknown function (DUF5666)
MRRAQRRQCCGGEGRQADGSILAATVEGSGEDDDENEQEGEVKGSIAAGSIAGACAANNLSFRIGSTTVRTSAQTRFDDTSCTTLTVGDSVEVKGARQADGSVLASRVQLEDGHDWAITGRSLFFQRSDADERPIEQQVVHDLEAARDEEGQIDQRRAGEHHAHEQRAD